MRSCECYVCRIVGVVCVKASCVPLLSFIYSVTAANLPTTNLRSLQLRSLRRREDAKTRSLWIARLAVLPSSPFHPANLRHPLPSSPILSHLCTLCEVGQYRFPSPIPLGSLTCDIYDLAKSANLRTAKLRTANCELRTLANCELRTLANCELRTLATTLRRSAKPLSCETA